MDQLFAELAALRKRVAELEAVDSASRDFETRYRKVADITYDWESLQEMDGRFTYVSPSCERITGYPPEALLADPSLMKRIIHPDDRLSWEKHLEFRFNSHEPFEGDFRILHRDGAVKWISHVCQPAYDESGALLGRRSSNRDITDRKEAEEAQRESEERFKFFMDHLPGIVFIKDAESRLLYINRHMREMLGASDAWIGKSTDELFSGETAQKMIVDDREALARGYIAREESLPCSDGRTRVYSTQKFAIARTDKPPLLGGIAIDITDHKLAEAELQHREKTIPLHD